MAAPSETCENCGREVPASESVDGLCRTCWHRALTRYAHEIPPEIMAQEVAWGKDMGWLE